MLLLPQTQDGLMWYNLSGLKREWT